MSEADILRILVSTDNHLGVWEKDEVRKDDSFVSFEEVFQIAADNHADLVLLGGDLFHDNTPSRTTIVRAMDIMSRHCMGDRPVRFQVVSDQQASFTTGRVNFEDPNYNVGLPVLTIHGNHDDPAGAENLSAVDILSTCRLLNYFGKAVIEGQGVGKLRIAPVLLRKGATNVALYGLGNLRDERLCRLFQTPGCVEWARPEAAPGVGTDDWFSVFVLHQNRVPHTQSAKNCLREGSLARFLDLVVWGHEHESLADPWESVDGRFSVVQPGSSVATALSEGEAKRKHCVMVEIAGHQWRCVKHPLLSVRPFQFASVALAEQPGLDPGDAQGVQDFLERKVDEMIEAAHRERAPSAPELPLVRLRVNYTGFSTISTQRFGQRFVGRVANPNDMVLWQKAAARRSKDAAAAGPAGAALVRPEALDEARIEDLIGRHLQHDLEILPEEARAAGGGRLEGRGSAWAPALAQLNWRARRAGRRPSADGRRSPYPPPPPPPQDLAEALHEFVEKDDRDSMREAVARALRDTQTKALRDERAARLEQDADLLDLIQDAAHVRKEAAVASAAQRAMQAQAQRAAEQQRAAAAAAAAAARGGGLASGVSGLRLAEDDDMADDVAPGSTMPPPPARKPAAAKRAAPVASTRGGKQSKLPAAKSPLSLAPSRGSTQRGTQQGENSRSVGAAGGRRAGSSRAAAAKATQKLAAAYKDVAADEGGEEGDDREVDMVDLLESEGGSGGDDDADSSGEELEAEELELTAPASVSRKRGRTQPQAPPSATASRRRGAAPPSQHTGGTTFVVSDDEDAPPQPSARRRAGGAGALAAGSRSQGLASFGTGSQQGGGKGWGTLQ